MLSWTETTPCCASLHKLVTAHKQVNFPFSSRNCRPSKISGCRTIHLGCSLEHTFSLIECSEGSRFFSISEQLISKTFSKNQMSESVDQCYGSSNSMQMCSNLQLESTNEYNCLFVKICADKCHERA